MPTPRLAPVRHPRPGVSTPDALTAASGETSLVARLRQSELFRDYQQAFESTTGLPLVLREPGSLRPPLQDSKLRNPFCALLTQSNPTCAACLELQQRVEAAATHEPHTLRCYAGLSESAIPVRVGDQVVAFLQTGQVFLRAPSNKGLAVATRLARREANGPTPEALAAAYFQTRVLTSRQYGLILRLLGIFAQHLATVSNQVRLSMTADESSLVTRARRFITENHSRKLGLSDVARAVNSSPSYLCRSFKQTTGLGLLEFLARTRVEAVKQMLLNPHTHVGEAGFAAGFQSLSQYNRLFHRIAGESPSRYRERLHGTAHPAETAGGSD